MRPVPPSSGQTAPAVPAAGQPLFHAAWLFAAGIALSGVAWLRPAPVLLALLVLIAVCAIAALRAPRLRWLALGALWILLGLWCAEMQPAPAPASALLQASDGLLREADGVVIDAGLMRDEAEQETDEPATPAQRVDLQLSSLEIVNDTEDAQQPIDGSVRLTVRWPVAEKSAESGASQPFHCGERIRALVRLYPPEVFHDPGAWSQRDYLLEQGITSSASVQIERIERLDSLDRLGWAQGGFFRCRLGEWQRESSARLLALPVAMQKFPAPLRLSDADAILLSAIITGDRTLLSSSLREGFSRTGSFHMLVVSGLHLGIVAGFLLWLLRRLRVPRVPATLVTVAASCTYALFTGFAEPVQRALWMVSLYLVGRLFFRERSALNTIGFAALVMLCANPRSLFDSSFQMTLLAVIAIGGIAAPLLRATIEPYRIATEDLRRIAIDIKLAPHQAQYRVILRMFAASLGKAVGKWIGWSAFPWTVRMALRLVEALAVTAIVELAMTLPMAIYFHRITLFALPVNLLILPLLAALMPAALVTWAVLLVAPSAAVIPAAAAALLLHIGTGVVHFFGSLALGDWRIASPLAWQVAAFCALLAAAMALAANPARTAGGRWARRGARYWTWAVLLGAAAIATAPRAIVHPRNALLVEAIDVGQGDSLLLITPEGRTLLVDGGGIGGGPRQTRQASQSFDIGEEVVSAALWARGIRHLDAVALTHAHSDHMGGLPAVLRSFHPDELWVGNNPYVADYDALLAEAADLRVRVRQFHAGDALALGGVQIRVLAPEADYQPGAEPANNDSLVLRAAYGATSVLLAGDAEGPEEQAMLREPQNLASTLLKVGHHGSVTSTHPDFLARVSPRWAVISCGLRNHYGHPRPEILSELENAGVKTFVTDIHGATCFALDGKEVTARSECGSGDP
jgi:competence protein ComEC